MGDLLTRVKTLLGSKTQDNKGWIRQGKFTPGKNLGDVARNLFSKTDIDENIKSSFQPYVGNNAGQTAFNVGKGLVTKTIPTFLNTAKNDISMFGEGLGSSIGVNKRAGNLVNTAKQEHETSLQAIQKAIQLKKQGNIEGYRNLLAFNNKTSPLSKETNRVLGELGQGKNKAIAGGMKTAGYLPNVFGGGVGQYAISGLLGAGISSAQGKDPLEGAGEALASAKKYSLVTQFSSPLTRSILGSSVKNLNGFQKAVTARSIGGVGNIIEDEVLAKLEQQNPGTMDRILSFAIGFAMSGTKDANDLRLRDFKKMLSNEIERSRNQSWRMSQVERDSLEKFGETMIGLYKKAEPSLKKAFETSVGITPKEKIGEIIDNLSLKPRLSPDEMRWIPKFGETKEEAVDRIFQELRLQAQSGKIDFDAKVEKPSIPEVKFGNDVSSNTEKALRIYEKTGDRQQASNTLIEGFENEGIVTNYGRAISRLNEKIDKYFPSGVPEVGGVKSKVKITPAGNQNGRIDTSVNPQTMNQGMLNQSIPQKVKLVQPQPQSQSPTLKISGKNSLSQTPLNNTTKQRGLVESIQEAPNISKTVKVKVGGSYTPKTNKKLMGEAQALLQNGATIDFKNTQDLDKKVAATIQEALNQQKAGNNEAAANLYNNLSEHATELGRGVQAFSLLKNMSPEAIALSAAGKIKKYNATHSAKIPELTGEQIKIISDKVQALDLLKGREKNIAMNELEQTINSFIPSSLGDKFLTVWKAGLLTSIRTHERNFVGNSIHGIMEVTKDIPATIADKIMSLKTGKRSTTFTLKGLNKFASKETKQQVKDIISKGYDPSEQINKFDHKTITWGKNAVEQILKKYTDTVFRTLGASDKPFYNASLARSLYDQAATAAINAKKRGNTKFIEKLVSNPTEEMLKIGINEANISVFKNKNTATNVANTLKRTLSKNEWTKVAGEITIPFTGVPSSILGQIGSYSPIGLLNGIRKTGKVLAGQVPELQREAAKDLGRGVIGTAIFGLGSYLMSKGIITGQPENATEARQWDLENKPRNSIMVGGKWRSLNSIGPEAVVFLAGAKLNEEMNNPEGSFANYGMTLGKDYLDQSFVQGLQAPVNAITDPQRYGKSYVGSLTSSFIPNIVKDASRAIDPTARETNNLSLNPLKNDYIKAGIPFARNTLLPKRDALGNKMPQEPTGIGAFTDLFNSKTPISNAVVGELSRLYNGGNSATPSKLTPQQTILKQKVKLTFEQLDKLEAGVGEVLRPKLEILISDPNYQKLDDEAKAKAIDNVVQDTRLKYKNINASDFGVSGGGYLDSTGNYKTIDTTPIPEPKLTGNKTIDDKLKLQYKNAVIKQQTDLVKSQQTGTESDPSKIYSYIDDDGNYKTVDLTPIEYPKLTGNEVVDKKLKSSYYSAINSQINNVIKLGQSGQITEEEMISMVTALNEQYTNGKTGGSGSRKKVSFKISTSKLPSLAKSTNNLSKLGSYKISKKPNLKLSQPKKIAVSKSKSNTIKISRLPTMKVTKGGSLG